MMNVNPVVDRIWNHMGEWPPDMPVGDSMY